VRFSEKIEVLLKDILKTFTELENWMKNELVQKMHKFKMSEIEK
jgi:hypothetical protein